MYKVRSISRSGYTVVELLVVISVIATLALVYLGGIQNSRARGRDTERVTDIDNLRSRLESYYSDHGGYPETFTTATFSGLDPASLMDPNGTAIVIVPSVANQLEATSSADPSSAANYSYIPYPTGCTAITCTGYVLKAYIEQPNDQIPNPYVRRGLNNN